ncbi:excinuclease ABC subunit UvrA [Streptomyces sp. ST1015]|uniref:excinuclease ABC subunit UvrA n=1 Tax=unclassified Streptomyces TaxID=2593676 RepID=UPI000DD6EA6C|nr:excinuclease ABC subunit UvrA [Streptomyces sp. ST1015]QZZ25298.1 excinuclease ABC subunit UvrA [Streptomyces sp. ST1015]
MSAPHPAARPLPGFVEVRGARHNNLKGLDVDIPLWALTVITGVSGSGKSSLALGTVYAEGSRRYLDALTAYQRKRVSQTPPSPVDRVTHVPSAVALRQRPPTPGRSSTVGTLTEVYNLLRLLFSRVGEHRCPNGHLSTPTLEEIGTGTTDENGWQTCPECGAYFQMPASESFSFNSPLGACPTCSGLGTVDDIDDDTLVPDDSLTLDEGAVASWKLPGRREMPLVVTQMGVPTDVPFRDLTEEQRHLVLDGPPEAHEIAVPTRTGRVFRLNMTYVSARRAVTEARDTAGAARFTTTRACPACHGTRLRAEALATLLDGRTIAETSALTLDTVLTWAETLSTRLPRDLKALTDDLAGRLAEGVRPLIDLGLAYLTLDRPGPTLSTGELQRIQLAATLHAGTAGVLYVLDEPSIGLHPANLDGLLAALNRLADDGNTVLVVDHDLEIMRAADHLIEIGPGAGRAGGTLDAQGTTAGLAADPRSVTGPYLAGTAPLTVRTPRRVDESCPRLRLHVTELHNLRDLSVSLPLNRLTLVTGVSGSGKSSLILDSLAPALRAHLAGSPLPDHVGAFACDEPPSTLRFIDATPIGANSRSTPATYTGALDAVRKLYAATPEARERGWNAGHFSYNTKAGQCPGCQGLGELSIDIQYLPDLPMPCATCHGGRYDPAVLDVVREGLTIADVLRLTVDEAAGHFAGQRAVHRPLHALREVGLGYLTLGEPTPSLSGGEAQRMRLSTALHSDSPGTVYVFDEPSVGLHPKDVATLVTTLDRLLDTGATVIVIDHDMDLIWNADWVLDIGPGPGPDGGRLAAEGTPEDLARAGATPTGRWLARSRRRD